MEDLLGIAFMAVMFFVAVYAKASKNAQRQSGQRQQWPGPVAGPGPMYPPPQRPIMPPMPSRQPASPYPTRPRPVASVGGSQEGVRLDGLGPELEGPRPDETVDAEIRRFDRDIDQFDARRLPQMKEELEERHLAELRSDIGGTADVASAPQLSLDAGPVPGLAGMLADRNNLAQAVVLAEVLGKPRALRGRR